MKRMVCRVFTSSLLAGLVMMLAAPAGFSQTTYKMGFVNLKKVFDETPQFQSLEKELKNIQTEKQSKLKQKEGSLSEEYNQLRIKKDLLPEKNLKEMQSVFAEKQNSFAKEVREEQVDFEKQKDQRLNPLIEELRKVVEAVAKEEGYAFIFKDMYLAYSDPQFDITDKVIKRLTAQGASAPAAAAPAPAGAAKNPGSTAKKKQP